MQHAHTADASRATKGDARAPRRVSPSPLSLALLQDAFGLGRPPVESLKALLQKATPHHHRPGEQLLSREDAAEHFWLLASGQASLGLVVDGRMLQQTRLASAGEWLDACSPLLGEGACYMEDAIAETSLTVWSMPASALLRCGLRHPSLLHGLATVLAARVSSCWAPSAAWSSRR